MKTKLLLLTMLSCMTSFVLAQQIPVSTIDINNVRATILGIGSSYSVLVGNEQTWEVPKDSGKSPLFQHSLWIGGRDVNEQIHFAGNKYNQNGRDYWMGPLNYYGYTSEIVEMQYEYIWNLTRNQIEDFIANHGQPGYVIPNDILTWPAHGGEQYWPYLAPFIDVNDDGHYDPHDGDYPDIRGDQCLFFIFNDHTAHTETHGEPLRVEIQAMVYAFDEPSDEILNNTVFFHYNIINRSTFEYSGTYFGIWNDWDLGYPDDDYVGCDARLGACYAYNGLPVDGNGEPQSYGENPPVQLFTLLAGPYKDRDLIDDPAYVGDCEGFNNYYNVNYANGVADDERLGLTYFMMQTNDSVMGDPDNARQMYYMLKGYWKDGNRVQYGGNGYPGMSGVVGPACNYMFPGDSDPCNFGTNGEFPNGGFNINGNYWTEASAGNEPGDRRGLAVSGPFTFMPAANQPLDFAMTTVWSTDTQSALDRIEEAVTVVKSVFENAIILDVPEQPTIEKDLLTVYPNPCEGSTLVKGKGRLTIMNALGQLILTCDIDGETALTLPSGLYLVRLENENGCSFIKVVSK